MKNQIFSRPAQVAALALVLPFVTVARLPAVVFEVNSLGDTSDAAINGICDVITESGVTECTLRAAIEEANATPEADEIHFEIAGCPGDICVIELVGANLLPDIVAPVTIDGTTQTGNESVCTLAIQDRPAYRIVLDGDQVDVGPRLESGSSGSTIRGLNVRNFFSGLAIIRSSDNVIECNFLGTDETGTAVGPGNAFNGVIIGCESDNNIIGGPDPEDGNLISGNNVDGVQIIGGIPCSKTEPTPDGNAVLGNFIGTQKDGVSPLGNVFSGVSIFDGDGPDNTVIGAMPDGSMPNGNVISANETGVFVSEESTGTLIVANLIGTDRTGSVALGNTFDGISLLEGFFDPLLAPTGTRIGGAAKGLGNVISDNGASGIYVLGAANGDATIEGNLIGTDITGTVLIGNAFSGIEIAGSSGNRIGGLTAGAGNVIAGNVDAGVAVYENTSRRNQIRRNSIFSNVGLGIDLGDGLFIDGPTDNDVDDPDRGPNLLQNFPEIESVVLIAGPSLEITYSVPSVVLPLRIEFFLADGDREEGEVFLGADFYNMPGSRTATIPAGSATAESILAATATDAGGNTSEFGIFGLIFADGFESGDTSKWTDEIP